MTMPPMGFVHLLSNVMKGNSGALENVKMLYSRAVLGAGGEWTQLTADKPINQK